MVLTWNNFCNDCIYYFKLEEIVMNFKEFFKLTKWKIFISILIFVLFVPFIYLDSGIRCIQAPCGALILGTIIQYLLSHNFLIYAIKINYLYLVLGIMSSYLLSSLICNKIKFFKKNERR